MYFYFVGAIEKVLPITSQTAAIEQKTQTENAVANEPVKNDTHNVVTAKQAFDFFRQNKFEDAMTVYEELLLVDEEAAIALRRQWYEQSQAMLKIKDFVTLEAFLAAFLQRFPYDLNFLATKAETLANRGKIDDAINIYYSMISYTFEVREEEYYQARIRHLANEQLERFKTNLSWQAIIDFVDLLQQQESGYPPYVLAQAQAYINLDNFDTAEQLLEEILQISFYHEKAQALLDQIRKSKMQQTAIKLQPMGEHYLVNGQINQSSGIKLMIDTGASVSVLTRVMFDEIQGWTSPEYMGETLLNTAGGQVNAPIYQFDRFQIDDFYVENMSFVVLDIDNMSDYHGLLGMNFLKQFKFEIDQSNNLLILSP